MQHELATQEVVSRIQPGTWIRTEDTKVKKGGVVDSTHPRIDRGRPRLVSENVQEKGEGTRYLRFIDGTRTASRAGTAMVWVYNLDDNGQPLPEVEYPECPTCGSTDPGCRTKDGAWAPKMHAARAKLPVTTTSAPTKVEVDGVEVAETRKVEFQAPEPAKPPVGEVWPTDLVDALTAVLPHTADPRDALPMLSSVHFETRDGQLVLVATDRYTLATYAIPWEGGAVNAHVEKPKDLLAWAKKVDRLVKVTLTFGEHEVEAASWDSKATFRLYDGDFVKWDRVLVTPESGDEWFGFNPVQLAKFVKAGEKNEPMRIAYRSPTKPFRVEVGERFVGMVMPVRLPEREGTAPPAKVEEAKVENPCPECGHGDDLHYAPGTGDENARCRVFTCPCKLDWRARQLDTVDGSMAAAAAGESGRRVERDADGKVRIVGWSSGERDVETPAGRTVHISEDGEVTEMVGDEDEDDDEPVAVTPITPVEKPVVTTSRCSVCKGYGVVRKYGEFKGTHYKTAKGAAEATEKGNSMPCTSIGHGRAAA